MQKLNKVFIAIIVLAVVTPSVAMASWWNPFTWFGSNVVKPQTVFTPIDISTTTTSVSTTTVTIQTHTATSTATSTIKNKPAIKKQVSNTVITPDLTSVPVSTPAPASVPLCPNGATLESNCATFPNGTTVIIEPTPPQAVPKTNQQICEDSYGQNSVDSGNKNESGGPVCFCKSGYMWNSTRTSCQNTGQQSAPIFLPTYNTTNYAEQSSQNATILLQQQQQQQLQQVQSSLDQMKQQQEAQRQQQLFQQQLQQMRPNCNQVSFYDRLSLSGGCNN